MVVCDEGWLCNDGVLGSPLSSKTCLLLKGLVRITLALGCRSSRSLGVRVCVFSLVTFAARPLRFLKSKHCTFYRRTTDASSSPPLIPLFKWLRWGAGFFSPKIQSTGIRTSSPSRRARWRDRKPARSSWYRKRWVTQLVDVITSHLSTVSPLVGCTLEIPLQGVDWQRSGLDRSPTTLSVNVASLTLRSI